MGGHLTIRFTDGTAFEAHEDEPLYRVMPWPGLSRFVPARLVRAGDRIERVFGGKARIVADVGRLALVSAQGHRPAAAGASPGRL